MDVFCLTAVDGFGARVLASFGELAGSKPGGALERCSMFWAGSTERPERSWFWGDEAPRWSVTDEADPFRDFRCEPAELSRRAAFERVREVLARSASSTESGFRWLLEQHIPGRFGHAEVSVNLILVGALGEPGSGPTIVAMLEDLSRLRSGGQLTFPLREFVVAGLGAQAAPDVDVQRARATAACALFDLENHFGGGSDAAAVCCLVGEERPTAGGLDERSQIDVAAAGLLAIVARADKPLEEAKLNPFRLEWRGNRAYANRQRQTWDPEKPFLVLGAASLSYPRTVIQRILAGRFAADTCDAFASADPDAEPDAPLPASKPEKARDFVDQVAERSTASFAARGFRSLEKLKIWSWPGTRAVLAEIVDSHWTPLRSIYGRERFLHLPLEDWEQALEELEEFLLTGVVARRRQDLELLPVLAVESLDDGLEVAFRRIGLHAWRDPIAFTPRRVAVATLSQIVAEADAALAEGAAALLKSSPLDESEIAHLEKNVTEAKEAISHAIREVPSPVAVALRAVLFVVVGALLMVSIPIDFGPVDPAFFRAVVGGLVGACGAYFLRRRAYEAKRHLLAKFDDWCEAFAKWQEHEIAQDAFETAQRMLARISDYGRWLLDALRPLDEPFPVHSRSTWQPGGEAPNVSAERHRFLVSFSSDLEAAANSWRDLAVRIEDRCGGSQVCRVLPERSDESLRRLLNGQDWRAADGTVQRSRLTEWLDGLDRLRSGRGEVPGNSRAWLPFGEHEQPPGWATAATLDDQQLAGGEEERRRSTALGFFHLAEAGVAQRVTGGLLDRMAEFYGVSVSSLYGALSAHDDLFRHLAAASELTVADASGGEDVAVLIHPEGAQALARTFGGDPESWYGEDLLCMVRASTGWSAADLILGPDPDRPESHLGRAYIALKDAIEPIRLQSDQVASAAGADAGGGRESE